ncbi:hypothetical protein E5843_14350 [Luteimonas yindakuii]|uniref:hypothetical protein n=1 Tax=Luteimonas yindakuii TaxID=2565782 RepID=UPI0011078E74|nr:hypothetical protein [Luteimonas yindakuii]QCU72409.1 hypothetical protein E5843_14350 [Luteimonas yindakuii]
MKTNLFACRALAVIVLLASVGCGQEQGADEARPAPPRADAATADAPASGELAQLAVLDSDLADIPVGGHCSLDAINGHPAPEAALTVGDEVVFSGWVGDAQGQVPDSVHFVLVSQGLSYDAMLDVGVDRLDVAQALGQPGLARSGFGLSTVLAIEPGTYTLAALMGSPAGSKCLFNVDLVVAAR